MRIGMIGAGALGLYYGALLQKAGHDVHFLLRRDYQSIISNGLQVKSPRGNFMLSDVQGYRRVEEIGVVDLVLIGLKAYSNDQMVSLVAPLVGPQTVLLTLQNGLGNEEVLARAFGAHHVIGGVAFLCCNRGEPGVVNHLDQGAVRLAEFADGLTERVIKLSDLFTSASIPCEACADLQKIRWEKLAWNIPFNGLCALTGLSTDRLLSCPEMVTLIKQLMFEVVAAANSQGLSEAIDADAFIQRLLDVTAGMGPYKPSMMVDRLENRPIELEAIYGVPLDRAKTVGMPMVRVAMLHALLMVSEVSTREQGCQVMADKAAVE
ncbi:MAG: putative 2-dehydropantoate 2-reductase [Deltaproteobacteria bacterium]|jgi:2-dehydropantoate 2-reductase|nr:putative 2-dehydropantoate 2-reductase [Deltaproteobacteria bacterium]